MLVIGIRRLLLYRLLRVHRPLRLLRIWMTRIELLLPTWLRYLLLGLLLRLLLRGRGRSSLRWWAGRLLQVRRTLNRVALLSTIMVWTSHRRLLLLGNRAYGPLTLVLCLHRWLCIRPWRAWGDDGGRPINGPARRRRRLVLLAIRSTTRLALIIPLLSLRRLLVGALTWACCICLDGGTIRLLGRDTLHGRLLRLRGRSALVLGLCLLSATCVIVSKSIVSNLTTGINCNASRTGSPLNLSRI